MKKLLFIAVVFIGLSTSAQTQKELRVNFFGGLNSSLISDSAGMDRANYFFFGFNNNIKIGAKSYLNLDVNYALKGGKYIQPIRKYSYDYIEVPFYYEYEPFKDLRLGVGARTSYLMRARRGHLDGASSSGIGYEPIEKPEIFNFGYLFKVSTKLQKNFELFVMYDSSVSFSHQTLLHQDLRFGLAVNITNYQIVKSVESL